jgi:hypothetical protein
MLVPDNLRKSVVFLLYPLPDNKAELAGSAFFVGYGKDLLKPEAIFLVTAKHVIDGVKNLGINEVIIRVNQKEADCTYFISLNLRRLTFRISRGFTKSIFEHRTLTT